MQILAGPLARQPGTYLLVMMLPTCKAIQVGRLGCIGFERGWYAYAGSAFGPGGLAARLRHHIGPVRKRHWHIDYLRSDAQVKEIWISIGPPCREHDWASILARGHGPGKRVPGFGCSDCRCPSHLLYFDRRPSGSLLRSKLGTGIIKLRLAADPAGPGLSMIV